MIITHSRRHIDTVRIASFCLLAACILLLVFAKQALAAATEALSIFWTRVFPALFPFYVLTSMLGRLGAFNALQRRVKGAFLPCLLFGGIAGTPNGARISRLLSHEEYAAICNLASPMFLLGVVSIGMCKDPALFWPLAIAHYGSALLLLPVCKRRGRAQCSLSKDGIPPSPGARPGALFSDIGDGMLAMLGVGGAIVFFYVLADTAVAALFSGRLPGVSAVAVGLMEMTAGCARVAALPIPPRVQAGILAFLTTFGGFCIFAQVMMTAKLARPGEYLLQKLMQGCAAGLLAFLLSPLFQSAAAPAWSNSAETYAENALITLTFVLCAGVGLVASYLMALLIKRARTDRPGSHVQINNRRPRLRPRRRRH